MGYLISRLYPPKCKFWHPTVLEKLSKVDTFLLYSDQIVTNITAVQGVQLVLEICKVGCKNLLRISWVALPPFNSKENHLQQGGAIKPSSGGCSNHGIEW